MQIHEITTNSPTRKVGQIPPIDVESLSKTLNVPIPKLQTTADNHDLILLPDFKLAPLPLDGHILAANYSLVRY